MKIVSMLLMLCFLGVSFSGCGYPGPLYLPKDAPKNSSTDK